MTETRRNAVPNQPNASPEQLGEAMWQLKIDDSHGHADGQASSLPDRPGEPDCIFYLRNGNCGYGSNCKYNHPTHTGQGVRYTDELPQREGQPDCQFFLKTGTCKFGTSCKYHHPRDKHGQPVQLNVLGLPFRKDEKSCAYYLRTGSCKFGIACKFDHPQPATFGSMVLATGPSVYGYTGFPTPSTGPPIIGGLTPWIYSRNPYISNPQLQGIPTYMPLVHPPIQDTMTMQQGWSMNMGGAGIPPTDVIGQVHISSSKNYTQPGSNAVVTFPERPDQPECQYYMKTGSCKYGSSCKYHHPRERNQGPVFSVGPHGLPLRPGESVCGFYTNYGSCKYGTACKYDHPVMRYYNYVLPSHPHPEPSAVFPNQRISQVMWTSSNDSSSNTMEVPNGLTKSGEGCEVHELNNGGQEYPSTPTSAPNGVRSESS